MDSVRARRRSRQTRRASLFVDFCLPGSSKTELFSEKSVHSKDRCDICIHLFEDFQTPVAVSYRFLKAIVFGSQALFSKVAPYQCLGCIWSQRDKKENMSPTIRATVAQFNRVTNLVIVSLLRRPARAASGATPPQRARIVEKWIGVALVSAAKGFLRVSKSTVSREHLSFVFAGLSAFEELFLPQGHSVRPSVQCGLQTEKDLGCS